MEYLNFDVRIESRGDTGYSAEVRSPQGEASNDFEWPFTRSEMEQSIVQLGRQRDATSSRHSAPQLPRPSAPRRDLEVPVLGGTALGDPEALSAEKVAEAFGRKLSDAVFGGEVNSTLERSYDEAMRQSKGLRLRLHLSKTPELQTAPWEFMWNESLNGFAVLSRDTPVVRYMDLRRTAKSLTIEPPLRILVMISNPSDVDALDVAKEERELNRALADLQRDGLVEIKVLNRATLDGLQDELRRSDYHVFHFIGHGGRERAGDDGVLVLEDADGRGDPKSGKLVGNLLHDHRSMRLAVLNACDGARGLDDDPFAGVAQSLVKQGVPAVIAMQFKISDGAAITLAHEFYEAIADGCSVDEALAEARKRIFGGERHTTEWATPVLFMRAPDGRLFDFTKTPGRAAEVDVDVDVAGVDEIFAPAVDRAAVDAPVRDAAAVDALMRDAAVVGEDPPVLHEVGDRAAGIDREAPSEPPTAPLRILESVSILERCGGVARWATGASPEEESRGWFVAVALFTLSALTAVSAVALGVGSDFAGRAAQDSDETAAFTGLLTTLNWPFVLVLVPFAAWLTISFLIATDQAVGSINGWLEPKSPDGRSFSQEYEPRFHRFWRVWKFVAPLLVFTVVLVTEFNDWFAPLNDGAPWLDRDWSVAIRVANPKPALALFALNTSVFMIDIILVSCAALTAGVAAHIAGSAAGAWNKRHWLRTRFNIDLERLPNLDDVRTAVRFLLLFMVLALVVAVTATIENGFFSESGIDPGIVSLALAAIAVPIIATLIITVLWHFRGNIGLTSNPLELDPLMKILTVIIAVLVIINTALLLFA